MERELREAQVRRHHRQMQEELGLNRADTFNLIQESLNGVSGKMNNPRVILKFQTRDWSTGKTVPPEDLLSILKTAWKGRWSLAFIPPPTEEQLRAIGPVLRGK